MSEEELLEALGRELLGDGPGFGPSDPGRFIRFADKWIAERREQIQAALCGNPTADRFFERDVQDQLTDAGTVIDALATLGGRPPVSLLALILIRRGRDVICASA